LLHFYWAGGGKWGFKKALPTKENGELLFLPTKIQCAIVGIGLLGIMGLLWYRVPNFTYLHITKKIMIVGERNLCDISF